MPTTIPNNQKTDELTRARIAEELQQNADSIARSRVAGELQRQKYLVSREQATDKQKKLREQWNRNEQRKRLEKEASDIKTSTAKRLAAARALAQLPQEEGEEGPDEAQDSSQFQPQWPEEGTEESTIGADQKPKGIGHVPMEEAREQGPGKEEETLAPMTKEDIGKPVKEKPSAEGGGLEPEEPEYFGRTKPTPPAGEQPQKPGQEKPEEEEEETGAKPPQKETQPSEAEQAGKITADKNAAQAAQLKQAAGGAKGALGGPEEALAKQFGGELGGKAMKLYKTYKWVIWIGTFIITNFWWILGGLAIIALFIVLYLTVSYMYNHPTATFLESMWCGRPAFLGGGDFMQCMMKEAIEKAPEAAKAATQAATQK